MFKTIIFRMVLCFIVCTLFVSRIHGQRPILDEHGNPTGLINMNPDPDGEPWIAGRLSPLTKEEIAAFNRLPKFKVPEKLRGRQLPPTCDNSEAPEFRPIFNQIGGSCGQASGMGYHFTYERNLALGTLPTTKDNICAYGFTWNFVNGGSGSGSWPSAGYNIAKEMGCGHVTDFNNADNGGSGTAWMDGYEGYYNANDCHIVKTVSFSKDDVEELKNWFYDKGTGEGENGGCITFGSSTSFSIQTIQSGPYEGQKISTSLSSGSSHAMTLAGYSEEVTFDLNGDGRITSDIDVTRDGIIDLRDREDGAWQLVNSWGGSWNNSGKIWVMYGGFGGSNILGIEVEPFETQLMAKVTVTHSSRSSLKLTTGFSANINDNSPTDTKGYSKAFNKAGGSNPMEGSGGSSTIEIGLDVTEFADLITGGAGKIFLIASSSGGTGKIDKFSVMDYTGGAIPQEYVCDESDVTIESNTVLSVVISTSPTITFVSPGAGQEVEQFTKCTIKWGDNIDGNVKIELYKGSSLKETLASSTESDGLFDWDIPADQELGDDYTIKVISIDDPTVNDESAAFGVIPEILIAEFPYIQDFEDMDTGAVRPLSEYWEQLDGDDFDWIVLSGPTPSQQYESTGPTGDHTSGSGKYVYIEASSPNNPTKKADMITPKFNLKSLVDPEMTLWAQMKSDSNTMGDIYLDIEVDGTWKNDVLHLTDDHGSEWFEVKQDLTDYVGERVRFRFRGITGESWCGDMCIDDFMIDAETAINPVTIAPVVSYNLQYAGAYLMYSIPEIQGLSSRQVSLKLYNVQGQLVQTLVNNPVAAGRHMIHVDKLRNNGQALAAGLYVCRMEVGAFTKTVNVILR